MKLAVEAADDALTHELHQGLKSFNEAAMPGVPSTGFVVSLRDGDGTLKGGVIARVTGENCYIDTVWIDGAVRGGGLGTKMLRMAEEEARRIGARGVWLYTLSVQAKPFYEKLGYSEFAELTWSGSDIRRHFMRKDL
jgi:ribosomal protein S18 acetylase RimI-like enzyme